MSRERIRHNVHGRAATKALIAIECKRQALGSSRLAAKHTTAEGYCQRAAAPTEHVLAQPIIPSIQCTREQKRFRLMEIVVDCAPDPLTHVDIPAMPQEHYDREMAKVDAEVER